MKTKIILIDFENVQPKDLAQLRKGAFTTKVFCGASQTKISLDLAAELQPLGSNAEYIRIHGNGSNALDFHIAYYIGRLSTELPGAEFYIVSKDTGFDPLISHLKARGIACLRVTALDGIAGLAVPKTASLEDRIQKVLEMLLNRAEARPRTLKTLTALVKAQLNAHATESAVDEVIGRLTNAGMETQPDGKLTFPSL